MNKRQAKKYFKQINNTAEEHKSEEISNTKRIKHYTTVVRQRFPKPQVKLAKKRVRRVPQWRKRLGTAPQDEPVEAAEPLEE